jgi:hypothetical protein
MANSNSDSFSLIHAISPNNSATNGCSGLFFFSNNSATSTSITYTKNTTGTTAGLSGLFATGQLLTSSPLDGAVTAFGAGSSFPPSIVSGIPTTNAELFVAWNVANAAIGWTQDTANGWASPLDALPGGFIGQGGNQVSVTNAATPYAPTWTGQNVWATIIAGFIQASIPSTYGFAASEYY